MIETALAVLQVVVGVVMLIDAGMDAFEECEVDPEFQEWFWIIVRTAAALAVIALAIYWAERV